MANSPAPIPTYGFSHWKWWPRHYHDSAKMSKKPAAATSARSQRFERTVTMASTSNDKKDKDSQFMRKVAATFNSGFPKRMMQFLRNCIKPHASHKTRCSSSGGEGPRDAGYGICRNVADEVPDNSNFDLGHVFATDSAIRRATPEIYQYLADQECSGPSSPNLLDSSRGCQTPAFEGWVSGGQEDTNTVPMQLLNLAKQEENDLLLIYPKAKVQANGITTEHYIFVVKRLLFWYLVTENSMVDVPHSQAFARLLRRLSLELRSAPPSAFQFAYCSDPCDYLECLDEMLRDIEETTESLKASESPDQHVYVGRRIDIYAQCLIAAATELYTYN